MKKLSAFILVFICMVGFSACKTADVGQDDWTDKIPAQVKITFKQESQEDKVYIKEKGYSFDVLPEPVQQAGYTITWDKTELKNIQSDTIVTAIKTPNKYTITYNLGNLSNVAGVSISSTTQVVEFNSQFELLTPVIDESLNFRFRNWKISGTKQVFSSGVYTLTENITLDIGYTHKWTDL